MATVAGSLRNKVLVLDDVTTGDLTVTGSVTIAGTATTINSTNTSINDSLIELNAGLTGSNPNDLGLILERGSTGNNVFIGWDESADKVVAGLTTSDGTATGNLTLTYANFQAASATFTGGVTASGDIQAPGIYVGSANTSFDFYNNGTSYLNGTTEVNAEFKISSSSSYITHFNYQDGGNNIISQANSGQTTIRNNNGTMFTLSSAGNLAITGSITSGGNTVWHAGNDGPGSGLDADTVDGIHGASFLRSDAEDSGTILNLNGGTGQGANDATLYITAGNNSDWGLKINANSGKTEYGATIRMPSSFNHALSIYKNGADHVRVDDTGIKIGGTNYVWHAGNDGSGSGLDADTLDGHDSGSFLRSNVTDNYTSGTLSFNSGTALKMLNGSDFDTSSGDVYANMRVIRNHGTANIDGMYIGYGNDNSGLTRLFGGGATTGGLYVTGSGASDIKYNNASVFWNAANDGSGSGLDADLLDGKQGSDLFNFGYAYSSNNITRAVGSGTQWYKVASFSSGVKHITMKVHSSGDNTTGADSFFISAGSYGMKANIVRMPSSKYNGTKLEEVRTKYVSGASYEIWVKVASITTSVGYLQVFMNDSGVTSSLSAGTEPTVGTADATLPVSASDRINYSLQATSKIEAMSGFVVDGSTVWHAGNDGSGSGLDADTLDGINSGSFLRSDTNDTATGVITLSNTANQYNGHHYFTAYDANGNHYPHYEDGSSQNGTQVNIRLRNASQGFDVFYLDSDSNNITWRGNKVWNAGNDGSSSGLDADLLDGQHGSYYAPATGGAYVAKSGDTMSGALNMGNQQIYAINNIRFNDPGVNEGIKWDGGNEWQIYESPNGQSNASGNLQFTTGSGNGTRRMTITTGGVASNLLGGAAFSRPLLEITNGGTPTQIKITTNIPYSGSGASTHAHSVTIRGFQYGSAQMADLQIGWHVYNNQFYNRSVTSSGSWAPTVTLAVENNKVVIHLASPGYWPKMYVASMWNPYGGTTQAEGWSWSDAAISADSNTPNQTVPYKTNFGASASVKVGSNNVWHAGNDGSGSGLDADLLDGQQGSYYNNKTYTSSGNAAGSYLGGHYSSGGNEKPNSSTFGAGKFKIAMLGSSNLGFGGAWNDVFWNSSYNGSDVKKSTALVSSKYDNTSMWIVKQNYDSSSWGTGYLFWNAGNDGSGSGLDADTLDGQQLSAICRLDYDNAGEVRANNIKVRNGGNAYFYTASNNNLRGYMTAYDSAPHLRIATSGNESIGFYDGGPTGTENIRIGGGGDLELYQGHLQLNNNLELRSKDTGGTVRTITRINSSNVLQYGWSGSGHVSFMGGGSYTERMRIDSSGFIQINSHSNNWSGGLRMISQDGTDTFQIHPDNNGYMYVDKNWYFTGDIHVGSIGQKVWHQGNDGSGSGLDADTLDGTQKSDLDHAEGFKVWSGINADGTQAKRYHVARLYGTPAHWDGNWQNIEFHVTAESYESGTLKFRLQGDYGGAGSQANMIKIYLTEAQGPMIGRFRFVLGSPVDAGWDYSNQDTFYVDLFAEASHYSQWKIHAKTYGHPYFTSNPTSGAATTVFYSSPTVSNISTFNVSHNDTYIRGSKIWNALNDGSGSGLDADTLDGINSGSFLRSDAADTGSGKITLTATEGLEVGGIRGRAIGDQSGDFIQLYERVNIGYPSGWGASAAGAPSYGLSTHGGAQFNKGNVSNAPFTFNNQTIWHAGNDGSGSGLDADTVDGKHKDFLMHYKGIVSGNWDTIFSQTDGHMGVYEVQNISNTDSNYPSGAYTYGGVLSWQLDNSTFKMYAPHTGGLYIQNGWNNDEYSGWRKVWDSGNDGSGSGLDADTVDGIQASSFLRSDAQDSGAGSAANYLSLGYVHNTKLLIAAGTTSFTDTYNGSPWYGIGRTSVAGFNGTGYNTAQMAFYWGLTLRSALARIELSPSSNGPILFGDGGTSNYAKINSTGIYQGTSNLVWHAGNDGSGSGLDADTVDGIQADKILHDNGSEGDFRNQTSGSVGSLHLGHTPTSNTGSAFISCVKQTNSGQPGSIKFYISPTNTTNSTSTTYYKHEFQADGDAHHDGDVIAFSTTTGSDRKLKENIRNLEGSLDKTLKLRGVKFDWKDERKANNQLGFIAQEVQEVLPEVVKEVETLSKEGETHLTVNYPAVVPLLVEAIKEQQSIINRLEERLSDLESKLK